MKIYDEYDSNKFIEEREDHIYAKGGDGTLIRAIHAFKDKNKPFFGYAAGTENFLMNSDGIIRGHHTKQELFLIEVEVTYNKQSELVTETHYAFNDIAIGEFNAWINFECKHYDDIIGDFKGAGILISTTQGSTGANKNNHGTILPLSSKNWSVTGIQCNRNINYIIESSFLHIKCSSRENIQINIDGKHFVANDVEEVVLRRGPAVEVIFNDIQKFKKKRQQN